MEKTTKLIQQSSIILDAELTKNKIIIQIIAPETKRFIYLVFPESPASVNNIILDAGLAEKEKKNSYR